MKWNKQLIVYWAYLLKIILNTNINILVYKNYKLNEIKQLNVYWAYLLKIVLNTNLNILVYKNHKNW